MKTHELKCESAPFWAVANEAKKAEFRKDDRGFSEGDRIRLREFNKTEFHRGEYTGQAITVEITHIQTGFGIPDGFVMMSIRVIW